MSLYSKSGVFLGCVLGVSATFALEVLGAAGAVWGSSEVFGLRNDNNKEAWVSVAITVGTIALARYLVKYAREKPKRDRHTSAFCSSFWHAVVSPHEAIQDEFFYCEDQAPFVERLGNYYSRGSGRGGSQSLNALPIS